MAAKTAEIEAALKEAIFQGKYPPGTPLREIRLAKELGVSQATVRESLQRLENAGLVARVPNIGTTVVRLSPKDIRERVELRAMLEVRAALAAAERMGPEDFEELERRLAALTRAVEGDLHYEGAQADLDFHRYVWRCSGNATLAVILEQVTVPLIAFVSLLRHNGFQHLPDVVAAHEPLVAALRSRDQHQIETAFCEGATSSYREFIEDGMPSRKALAYGFIGSQAST
jgi:DNA-binding GntR family transcriptional regulator